MFTLYIFYFLSENFPMPSFSIALKKDFFITLLTTSFNYFLVTILISLVIVGGSIYYGKVRLYLKWGFYNIPGKRG